MPGADHYVDAAAVDNAGDVDVAGGFALSAMWLPAVLPSGTGAVRRLWERDWVARFIVSE